MNSLRRYGKGLVAFLRSVGGDVCRWVWEDVKGFVRGAGLLLWAVGVLVLVAAGGVLILSLLSAIF